MVGEHVSCVGRIVIRTHRMPLLSEIPGSFRCDSAMVRDGRVDDRCRE